MIPGGARGPTAGTSAGTPPANIHFASGRESFFADFIAAADSARFNAALHVALRDRIQSNCIAVTLPLRMHMH